MYNYAFLGGGLASLELAGHINETNASLLILERDNEKKNDRTWSVWTSNRLRHSDIVCKTWTKVSFVSLEGEVCTKDMGAYSYQQIRSLQFYDKILSSVKNNKNISIRYTEVEDIIDHNDHVEIRTASGIEKAEFVLDSRINLKNYMSPAIDSYNYVTQHFYGYFLETEDEVFDADTFTMMDFSYPALEDEFGFVYILPYTEKYALVELTFFSNKLRSDGEYTSMLEDYIKWNIRSNYTVKEVEKNKIPMLDRKIKRHDNGRVLKIGTNGGLTKVSTGYTFTRVMEDSLKITDYLKLIDCSFKGFGQYQKIPFHDRIILEVLLKEPVTAVKLFYKLFKELTPEVFFRFLDDKLGFLKLLSVYSKAPVLKFIKHASKIILKSNF